VSSGWLTNDVQTQERRNREWVGRYILGLPFPDVDDALVPQVLPRAAGFAITGTETNFVTFAPASIVIVHRITFTNTTDSAVWAWLAIYAGTFSGTYVDLIVRASAVQPREVITFEGPWFCAGGSIVRAASNILGVTGRVDYSVLQQTTPGITFVFGRVQLGTTPAALYTAPVDVRSAYVASVGITGLGSTDYATSIVLELLPSGQASAAQFYLVTGPMLAQDTNDIVGGYTLAPGDAIRAWRTGTDNMNVAFNVVEFRG
jgi:hypothetical protein